MSAEIYSKPNGTDSGDSRPSESPDSANRHFRRILGTAVGALLVTGMGGALYYQWASQVAAKSAAHEKASSAVTLAKNATEQAALCQTDYAGADYARAAKSCAEAASQGDPASERQLGLMYQAGNGVERNGETAIAWLTKAADHGDAIAQVTLGAMYLEGVGVKRDYAMALEWYRKAAVLGNADAQYNLGRMYYNGLGVGRDYADALSWLRLAATQGNVSAQKLFTQVGNAASGAAPTQSYSSFPVAIPVSTGNFAVGSTKAQVLALQGTPTAVRSAYYPRDSEQWSYGNCNVTFDSSGRVTAYSNTCGSLHVAMAPVRNFTIGSTKADVLATQGTPTGVQSGYGRRGEQWDYYGCSVTFDDSGRVKEYSNTCGELHVQLNLAPNADSSSGRVKIDRYTNDEDTTDYDGGDGN